jgi:hypothetical protein
MDIKRKTCDIRTWKKKHLFHDISSTNIDTLVPSLYQCVETRSTGLQTVVSAISGPPFQHLRRQQNVSQVSRFSCEPLYATNTSYRKQFFCPQKKRTTERYSLVLYPSSMVTIFTTETSL